MRCIHFVGGEKGGVGKSVVSRVLAQLLIDRAVPFVGFDADASHGSLRRHYADQTVGAAISAANGLDPIIEAALEPEPRAVLVDLPAQSVERLFAWIEAGEVMALAREGGVRLTFWHVSDGGFASVEELDKLLERLPPSVDVVVVRNLGRGRFEQLDASAAVQRLRAGGGHVVDLPELDADTMYAIDRHGSSFWAAIHDDRSALALPLMARRRARIWLERCHAALAPHVVRDAAS